MEVTREHIICNVLKTKNGFDPVFNDTYQNFRENDQYIFKQVTLADIFIDDFEVLNPYTVRINGEFYNLIPNREPFYKSIKIISFSLNKLTTIHSMEQKNFIHK